MIRLKFAEYFKKMNEHVCLSHFTCSATDKSVLSSLQFQSPKPWCTAQIILNLFKRVTAFLEIVRTNSTTQWITC